MLYKLADDISRNDKLYKTQLLYKTLAEIGRKQAGICIFMRISVNKTG